MEMKTAHIVWFISLCQCLIRLVSQMYIYITLYLFKVRSYSIIMITQEGIPITDPNYYASISHQDFMKVFRSDSDYDIPMVEERIEVMHEAGKALLKVSSFL